VSCDRLITVMWYGVATISRLLENYRSFLQKSPVKRQYSAKETYNFKKPSKCHAIDSTESCGMGWLRLVGSLKL